MQKTRCVIMFEEYIQSEKTKENYEFQINKFCQWLGLDSWDGVITMDSSDLREKIEDYVILLKNKPVSSNYIRAITFAIQSLCDSNEKTDINWKKIRKLLGKKTKPKKTRPYTTEEVKLLMGATKGLRNKALMLFFASSGVRRGAIPDMRIRDLKQMQHDCLMVTVYPDTDEEYITFINKEASDYLSRYHKQRKYDGEEITPDSYVFRNTYRRGKNLHTPKSLDEKSISNILVRAKGNAAIDTEGIPNMLVHAFRRRFNTILKLVDNANPTLVERLMGHDQGLDNSYFQPTEEQLFEEYQKGMADLTIDDSERLLAERKLMQSQMSEIEQERHRTSILEKELAEQKAKLSQMANAIASGKGELVEQKGNEYHIRLMG